MIKMERILCPIDFSDHSRRAIDHAFAVARCYGAAVTALHVFSPAPVPSFAPDTVVFEPIVLTDVDRQAVLADTRAFVDAEKAPGVPVEAVVREGLAATEILGQANAMNADLLVIGTHGRTGVERLFLGSVTEKVLRKARCPVLTVPKRLPDAVPARPVLYERILCPIDFSESSLCALRYAVSLAQKGKGHLTVLHVVAHEIENSADRAVLAHGTGTTITDFLRARDETLRRRLHEAVAGIDESGNIESVMTHGKPWREILRIATDRHSDLIVMGVRGRSAVDLLFFGSTAHHVVRAASCPVLTLRGA